MVSLAYNGHFNEIVIDLMMLLILVVSFQNHFILMHCYINGKMLVEENSVKQKTL